MKFQREIEKKYVISGKHSLYAINASLNVDYCEGVLEGTSIDTFWKAPRVDFIRLRKNSKELTVKITDRGTVTNRIEENIDLWDYETGLRWATAVFGKPVAVWEKTYYVYYLQDTIISLYQVTGDDRIFLEVEGKSMRKVNAQVKLLKEQFTLKQEKRSLFQIFGGKRG